MSRPLRDNEPTRWTAGEIRALQEEGEQFRAMWLAERERRDLMGRLLREARQCEGLQEWDWDLCLRIDALLDGIEVPPRPVTDEDFAALPIVTLPEQFDGKVE